jgi:hypothetical protein
MKRILAYIVVCLFCFFLGGIVYHGYLNFTNTGDILLDNTYQALDRAEKVRVRLEAIAEAVRLKLEATNKIIVDNQDKLKEEMAEVVKEQIKAVAKDILDKETYRKDIVELNAKLDKLLKGNR